MDTIKSTKGRVRTNRVSVMPRGRYPGTLATIFGILVTSLTDPKIKRPSTHPIAVSGHTDLSDSWMVKCAGKGKLCFRGADACSPLHRVSVSVRTQELVPSQTEVPGRSGKGALEGKVALQ